VSDSIRCAAYHCTLSVSACLARQDALTFDRTGVRKHSSHAFPECARCVAGASIKAGLNGSAEPMVARFRHLAMLRVRANMKARAIARALRWDRPEEIR
jgi:hypothetical protein